MLNLLIALVVLFATIALLIGTLLVFRQMKRKQQEQEALPMYSDKVASTSQITFTAPSSSRGSRLVITTPAFNEKESLMRAASVPTSPDVPEIRITFPEEVDSETGKRTSGRVVVVKVGEHSVGMEPVRDSEDLPPYQQRENGRFESLDLDRMGGLKEKELR